MVPPAGADAAIHYPGSVSVDVNLWLSAGHGGAPVR